MAGLGCSLQFQLCCSDPCWELFTQPGLSREMEGMVSSSRIPWDICREQPHVPLFIPILLPSPTMGVWSRPALHRSRLLLVMLSTLPKRKHPIEQDFCLFELAGKAKQAAAARSQSQALLWNEVWMCLEKPGPFIPEQNARRDCWKPDLHPSAPPQQEQGKHQPSHRNSGD